LGQHIHIGKPRRRLSFNEKVNIAKAIARVYPFLASLHAQPIPSNRGLHSSYCYSISQIRYEIPHSDHYCEISNSHNGTVEFRIFDSNIPQATLTVTWIMQNIAKKHLRNSVDFNGDRYPRERDNALRLGLTALNVINYLREIKSLVRDPELPQITCVKEILYLASRYFINPYQVLRLTQADHYLYFKKNFLNPEEYLDNILEIRNIRNRERLERWKNEAQQIENLDQLIGIAMSSFREITERLTHEAPRITVRASAITRSMVRREIELGRIRVTRIGEVYPLSSQEVAERISGLLRLHGDGYVNVHGSDYILNCTERYYVAWIINPNTNTPEILGSIAVNRNNGEITNLVVDRRFRRLGIANMLIEKVLSLNLPRYVAHVRKNNGISQEVFRMRGFTPYRTLDRSITLIRETGGS
jgi:GNAT superfamily N-acetyltransferase